MLRTYVYIPDELEERINLAVKARRVSKARVIRDALEKGIGGVKASTSMAVLGKIRVIAMGNGDRGPKDGSTRMNDYLWGKARNG